MSKFDLTLEVLESNEELHLEFEYSTALFKAQTIERFIGYFGQIVAEVTTGIDKTLSQVNVLTADELHTLLYGFNDTTVDYPREKTIIDLFEEQIEKTPDKAAVFCNDRTFTYRQLGKRADQIATFLKGHLTGKEIVGVFADRSIDAIAGLIAILKNGCAYLPLDIKYPAERLHYMLSDAKVKVVLANSPVPENIKEQYDVVDVFAIGTNGKGRVRANKTRSPGDLAYVMYTSGTTGRPKGVMITNRNVSRLVMNTNYTELNVSTRILLTASLSFDPTTLEIWGALLNGGTVFLFPEDTLLDSNLLGDAIEKYEINTMWLTTSLYNYHAQTKAEIFKGLKYLLIGGEALSAYHVNKIRDLYPTLQIVNGYGPTENTTFSTCHRIDERYEHNIPIGKPINNSVVYILGRCNEPVPVGVPGEIYVGGDGVGSGYVNNEALTTEKFVADPYRPGERMYKTGDLGRWLPNGNIVFMGRMDNQVKIRGFRIELSEIESRLAAYDGIKDVLVITKEGEGGKYLVCYFVSEEEISDAELKDYLSVHLPDHMIPFLYVRMKSLPLTSNGKIDRRRLPDPGFATANDYVAPSNETEAIVVEIWSEILKLDREVISVNAGFFELGGHSLRAISLINRIRERLAVELPLKEIFLHQTVQQQARLIMLKEKVTVKTITKVPEKEYYDLSPAQKRLYFLYEFDISSLAYNMPQVVKLMGELDKDRLTDAFKRLIGRHESLRTSFHRVDGKIVQKVAKDVKFEIDHLRSADRQVDDLIKKFIQP
ncbi:MAG: non-ribosomal peptide synthetase, partial [Marivirga sp.]|nr:non-ribosomal peptide synthetase [Marivirga sp.]